MHNVSPLGEFIRARRTATSPAQVGLPDDGPRRTSGLRRNEVAMLAGVSEGYYARLEQGREKHPSEQVLNALTRVFGLDAEAAEHLHQLAWQGLRTRESAPIDNCLAAHLVRLIDTWDTPALIMSRRFDVLAANDGGRALFSMLGAETSLPRFIFLDPRARQFYQDWQALAWACVASLRATSALHPKDRALRALVEELSAESEEFTWFWAKYDIRAKTHRTGWMVHPQVGALQLTYQSFTINGTPGHQLGTFQAEPGSPSERALRGLIRPGCDAPAGGPATGDGRCLDSSS
ncbi:helix-turn-helix transcriptional regulator [Streptomyces sp. S.PB5]|uniref:helix-turn-helix transcriptional regulator n=1 Tax=Streptomyces sp. S.PB5 TaxID=3020844 RepID=UPI0025B1B5D6|nr:helix-turn-helix transcriptional regulator [Streptomyces sp. S.PB5]MDN3027045.1 helix-turn-helix transcriptional regulator [Streptomyces sp. S.PB5]